MKITVAYCLPRGDHHLALAFRFLNSYVTFPPLTPHSTVILTDPGPLDEVSELFGILPGLSFIRREAPGWDINRYQDYCLESDSDMVVFCGGNTYFRRTGWLVNMASAFERHGKDNLFGSSGHCGSGPVFQHIRTTGFWCSPQLMNAYPNRVTQPSQRYPFEHGANSLTMWVMSQGRKAIVVDAEGEWVWPNYNLSPNGYHKGNQSALLVGDRLTAPPYFSYA